MMRSPRFLAFVKWERNAGREEWAPDACQALVGDLLMEPRFISLQEFWTPVLCRKSSALLMLCPSMIAEGDLFVFVPHSSSLDVSYFSH